MSEKIPEMLADARSNVPFLSEICRKRQLGGSYIEEKLCNRLCKGYHPKHL